MGGGDYTAVSRNVVRKKGARDNAIRKVKWDMTNTLFLTLKLTNLLLLLSFSTRKHKSMGSPAILSDFFEEQLKKTPTMPFGISACILSDNLSENSCKQEFTV